MAYNYSFADYEIYSAEDLNAITKWLVTSGIEDLFENGTAYNVSQFNEQGKLLYTSGIVPETCMTFKVVPDGEGKVLINPGKAFFDDGAVIEVEAGGESLSYVTEAKNYVYLKNDLLNSNVCYPCCTTDEPTGDYVLLAEIDETGVISDKRTYAKGRLPGYQSVAGEIMNIKDKIQIVFSSSTSGSGSKTFDIGNNNFSKIFSVTWPDRTNEYGTVSVYNMETGKYLSGRADESGTGTKEGILSQARFYIMSNTSGKVSGYITFSLSDGILTVDGKITTSLSGKFKKGEIVDMDIDLILF